MRCRFMLWSSVRNRHVRCEHPAGHRVRHENGPTWVALGAEGDEGVGYWATVM